MMFDEKQVSDMLARVDAVITGTHVVYTSGKHGSAYVNKDAIYPHTELISSLCQSLAGRFSETGVEVVIAPAVGGIILSQWTAYHLRPRVGRRVLALYADKDGARERQLESAYAEIKRLWVEIHSINDDDEDLSINRGLDRSIGLKLAEPEAKDGFVIKRGYDKLIRGKRVLVVEDILTTGASVAKVVAAVRSHDGHVVGVGALVNRGGVTAEDIGSAVQDPTEGAPKVDPKRQFPFEQLLRVGLQAWDEADCPLCRDNVPINTDVGKGREYLAKRGQLTA